VYWPFLVRSGKAFGRPAGGAHAPALGAVRLTLEDPHRGACCSRATEDALAVMAHDMGGEAVPHVPHSAGRVGPLGERRLDPVRRCQAESLPGQPARLSAAPRGLVMFNPLVVVCRLLALLDPSPGWWFSRSAAPSWCACSGIPIPRKRCSRPHFTKQQDAGD